ETGVTARHREQCTVGELRTQQVVPGTRLGRGVAGKGVEVLRGNRLVERCIVRPENGEPIISRAQLRPEYAVPEVGVDRVGPARPATLLQFVLVARGEHVVVPVAQVAAGAEGDGVGLVGMGVQEVLVASPPMSSGANERCRFTRVSRSGS